MRRQTTVSLRQDPSKYFFINESIKNSRSLAALFPGSAQRLVFSGGFRR
jgi:hypothetical protein